MFLSTIQKIIICIFFFCSQVEAKEAKIVQISEDTYQIFKEDKAGIYGNAHAMKVRVVNQAVEFAASQNKAQIPISIVEHPVGIWFDWASVKYTFKLVSPNDPIANRVQLDINSNLIVSRPDLNGTTNIAVTNLNNKDVYTELLKLDELRNRGLLTNNEFEAQKQKLLDSQ